MKTLFGLAILSIGLAVSPGITDAQIASGGEFKLDQSVVAGGGIQNASGGQFAVGGTTGQCVAGQNATGSPFSLRAGFWNASPPLAPTAANVMAVSGRVQTSDGRGIRNVRVTMTTLSGETQTVLSSVKGFFQFTNLPAGETYIFSATAKHYEFSQSAQPHIILEDTADINFIAFETIRGIQ